MKKSKNAKFLKLFTKYCKEHPEESPFRALMSMLNTSIYVAEGKGRDFLTAIDLWRRDEESIIKDFKLK